MNAIIEHISWAQLRLAALNDWFVLYDDVGRRRDCPSTYHEDLLREADELDRLGLVNWREWRDLRRLADRSFLRSVAGADYHRTPTTHNAAWGNFGGIDPPDNMEWCCVMSNLSY